MEYMYEIGQRVVLNQVGEDHFKNQSDGGEGVVTYRDELSGVAWYVVTWENGKHYSYTEDTIKAVDEVAVQEEQHVLKVGQRVYMTERGLKRWGNQSSGGLGTLIKVRSLNPIPIGQLVYSVDWDKGSKCSYEEGEIALAAKELQVDFYDSNGELIAVRDVPHDCVTDEQINDFIDQIVIGRGLKGVAKFSIVEQ